MNKSQAISRLVDQLSDRSWKVRIAAVRSIGNLRRGTRQIPTQLLSRLKDPHELVRIQAAEALAAIEDPRALRALYRALRDTSPLVRGYVAATIGVLGTTKDRRKLERSVLREHDDSSKIGFYTGIYNLSGTWVVPKLIALLESRDFEVRSAAAATLANIVTDSSNAEEIVLALRRALRRERTINARERIRASLKSLEKRFPSKSPGAKLKSPVLALRRVRSAGT